MEMSTEYAGDSASPYIHAVLDDIIQANSAEAPDIVTGHDFDGDDSADTHNIDDTVSTDDTEKEQ